MPIKVTMIAWDMAISWPVVARDDPTLSQPAGSSLRRGNRCEYLVTKRPGRRQESRASSGVVEAEMTASTIDGVPGLSAVPSGPVILPANFSTATAPAHSPPSSIQQASPSFPGWTSDFDEFFTSSLPFAMPDETSIELSDTSTTQSSGVSTTSSNTSVSGGSNAHSRPAEDIIYLFGKRPRSPHLPCDASGGLLPESGRAQCSSSNSFVNSHRCFSCVLETLNRLSTGMMCKASIRAHGINETSSWPRSVRSILSMNEHAIDEMIRILRCSCSTDSILLTTIVLVVLKVLECYAAAARMVSRNDSPSHHELQSGPSSPWQRSGEPATRSLQDRIGSDYDCQSAQLVLVELHRVQRVVNQLSPKLHDCKDGLDMPVEQSSGCLSSISVPISSIILEQLESEMRKRIRALSSEIIEALRRC
ncbi:uncharacterized protein PV09_03833 [Verruconis gallopava]|uniref:Aflatoxin regulatory protein domain-containing protein n=1 Tax=Verruconis gallopava TaxID=253628 RepID=A0A0D2AE89_9PEZI|nr:uncharacterized protein PV09_03833 [Verruconis gallopava]KIW05308.1 hypothetical protein PV09_03833 [Verruconis gallopava]